MAMPLEPPNSTAPLLGRNVGGRNIGARTIVGLDIGGAHIKAADHAGRAHCQAFALWKQPHQLEEVLRSVVARFVPPPLQAESQAGSVQYAVTMTGELADCFLDRGEGVARIVEAACEVLGPEVQFYAVDGRFVSAEEAVADDALVAASNWHAMATLAASLKPEGALLEEGSLEEGLLIDIGSTTSDLIPLRRGQVATRSRTDYERLGRGELLYVGIGRTPVCAVVDTLPYLGEHLPIMNEWFATTDDCAVVLGLSQPDETDTDTCDGRPRTVAAATNRLARMIGLDHRSVTSEDAAIMAAFVIGRVRARLLVAAEVLSSPGATWILSGHGSNLLSVPGDRRCLEIAAMLGPELSRVGPAYAVARLASELDVDAATAAER